jgi:hypothetical protein
LRPFGSVDAAIEVIDAILLARSPPSSTVDSGATDGAIRSALYTEASVMSTELAPVSGGSLTVGPSAVAPARIRGASSAEIGQQRIPMMAATVNPVTASQRMSLRSLIRIP